MKLKWLPWACIILAVILGWALVQVAQAGSLPDRGVSSLTEQYGWHHCRTSSGIDSNETTPDPNAQLWSDYTTSHFEIPRQWSSLSVSLYAYGDGSGDGDSNGATCDVNVFIVNDFSSWEPICNFTAAIGELEMDYLPVEGTQINSGDLDPNESYKWAEGAFSSTSESWATDVTFSGTTNGVGRCNFDRLEALGLIVLIDNISAATTIYPVVTGR